MKPGSKPFFRVTKPLLFVAGLAPLTYLAMRTFNVAGLTLGTNPVEELLHQLGLWGLKFLLLTLAVTPVRRWTGWHWLIRYRRMLGLYAFFYLLLHFLTYAILDQSLDARAILADIVKRPYITLGMAGLLLLVPLAITSTRNMMRRLGSRWQTLHRLVYVVAVFGVWHFYWQVKLDTLQPTVYGIILAALLATRLYYRRQRR